MYHLTDFLKFQQAASQGSDLCTTSSRQKSHPTYQNALNSGIGI